MQDLVEVVRRIPYLRDLPEPELRAVAAAGSLRHFASGRRLFLEGEPCGGAFALLTGVVHLRKLGPDGREQIMKVLEPVVLFNSVAVLDGGPNPATALAASECRVWHVTRSSFLAVMHHYPHLGLKLLPVLAAQSRYLVAQYEDISFRPVLGRVARLLLELSGNGRRVIDRHEHPISEMAARAATVPEAISRSLGSLKRGGAIDCTSKQIAVREPETLAGLAHVELTA